MATLPTHTAMNYFVTEGSQLLVNGISVDRLATRIGHSPFYAYDRSIIKNKVEGLKCLFGDFTKLHYAVKANPMPSLLSYIAPMVDGFDIASGKELTAALNAGMNPNVISFAGPAKSEQELAMALAAGITVNIESELELKRLIGLAEKSNRPAKVAIRVNPNFELKASGMKMGGGSQQFGIDAERVPGVINAIAKSSAQLVGLHIFTGSQNLRAEAVIEAHNNIFALARDLTCELSSPLPHINIGGGFGIPYFPGDTPINLQPVADNLRQLVESYHADIGATEFVLELGRYLVGESGLYVCQVTDIKESRGETFVMVNGGMHHHLANSGNFGQVIRKNYPVAVANKMDQAAEHKVTIVGPLCTPLDIVAKNMMLPKIELGDWIGVYQSGAYGFTASPKDFLSHPAPIEVLV